jgi:hypothetical protein
MQKLYAAHDRQLDAPEPGIAEVMVKNAGSFTGHAEIRDWGIVALWHWGIVALQIVSSERLLCDPQTDIGHGQCKRSFMVDFGRCDAIRSNSG